MSNLFTELQEQARRRPTAIALWQCRGGGDATSITYAALAADAAAHARAFVRQAPGAAIIPLLLPKNSQCVAAMFGAIGAGRAFACINRKLRAPQINDILNGIHRASGGAKTFALTDGPGIMTLAAGLDASSAIVSTRWGIVRDETFSAPQENALSKLRRTLPSGGAEDWKPGAGDDAELPELSPDPSRPGCCLFTSGSTGAPKGVLGSEVDLGARARAEAACFGITSSDVLLSVLPFSFDVGLNQLLSAVQAGCTLVLMDSFFPTDILKAAGQFAVTGISGVPAVWLDMLNAGMAFGTSANLSAGASTIHSSLRYITVSGGDLPSEHLDRLPAMAPNAGIFKTYGQSEAFRATALRPDEFGESALRRRSVGRPFPGVHVYIVRENGALCPAGEEGEIVHTGLGIMLGYLDGEHSQKLRPNPFRGESDPSPMAIFTGDLGYLDQDGFLYVKGRRDAMFKVSGNRIYPAEIAAQLMVGGNVLEGEVIGTKLPDGDSEITAFVVLPEGAPSTSELRRQLATRLPSYMIPTRIVSLPQIPRTPNGKPDRPALLRLLENEQHAHQQ